MRPSPLKFMFHMSHCCMCRLHLLHLTICLPFLWREVAFKRESEFIYHISVCVFNKVFIKFSFPDTGERNGIGFFTWTNAERCRRNPENVTGIYTCSQIRKLGTCEAPAKRVQLNISQHCWPSICKPRPNDRNILTHATYRSIVGRNMLRAFGHPVAACCELNIELVRMPWCNIVARTWTNDYNIM